MKCPVCKTTQLKPIALEADLAASTCPECEGKWISSTDYWNWLDRQEGTLPEKPPENATIEVSDRQRAKLCPQCRHIMLRYRVGRGLSFYLDHCGSCNGVWFDRNEWEALKQRNLHDEVHLVFSNAWQNQLRQEEARDILDTIYSEKFREDYEKIKEIKAWLDDHPERSQILSYLSNPDPYSVSLPQNL